jgi:hypothetical protein
MAEMHENNERIIINKHKDGNEISNFAWAFVLLWAGLVFLAENLGYLHRWISTLPGLPASAYGIQAWSIVFLGAGLIFFIEAIVQIFIPGQRKHFTGPLIMAAVGMGLGLGQVFSWSLVGPFILIAIGISFLLRGTVSR